MTILLLCLVGALFGVGGYGSVQPEPRGAAPAIRPSRLVAAMIAVGSLLAMVRILGLLLPVLAAMAFGFGAAAGWFAYKLRVWLTRLR